MVCTPSSFCFLSFERKARRGVYVSPVTPASMYEGIIHHNERPFDASPTHKEDTLPTQRSITSNRAPFDVSPMRKEDTRAVLMKYPLRLLPLRRKSTPGSPQPTPVAPSDAPTACNFLLSPPCQRFRLTNGRGATPILDGDQRADVCDLHSFQGPGALPRGASRGGTTARDRDKRSASAGERGQAATGTRIVVGGYTSEEPLMFWAV